VKPQAPLTDGYIGPDLRDQVTLIDWLAGARNQGDQEIKRSSAERLSGAVSHEKPLAYHQAKWPEANLVRGLRTQTHRQLLWPAGLPLTTINGFNEP
jgi:hypothetical protein